MTIPIVAMSLSFAELTQKKMVKMVMIMTNSMYHISENIAQKKTI